VKVDVLIVGAGFAGASTAFHLARGGFTGSVLVVDREDIPGYHASGRNASLVLQSVDNPAIREIVAASVVSYLEVADKIGYRAVGSLLLGREEQLEKLRDPSLVDSCYLDPGEARGRVPLLEGHQFEVALLTGTDGVMDISRLLQYYLDGARQGGCQVRLSCPVEGLQRSSGGFTAQTGIGPIEATVVVNGAGAWAPAIAEMAGIDPLPMKSFKRHLFVLDSPNALDEGWPFAWSIDRGFYFRPESGGLLFSACDEELALKDFVQTVNPQVAERLAELISRELPALEDALQRRVWSCFRTKTPTGNFHLGWSERAGGFFWTAGLGGHGMGASWEVGRRAAAEIRGFFS
jgi:glycine/D-amino acid oxidase-like deaminating enzyme